MPRTALMLLFLLLSAPAWAIYKCESEGKVGYSQTPCPSGAGIEIASENPSLAEVKQAQQQTERQKKEAERLEKARHQREAKEEKEQRRIAHANAARQKKCANLALRKKWAEEDALAPHRKGSANARRKAQRAAEKYQMECAT